MTLAPAVVLALLFSPQAPPAVVTAAAPSETYALDIAEKRIDRESFEAGTAVRIGDAQGVQVHVGAGVAARTVAIVLRNVNGTVRFRADLSRLPARPAPAAETDPRQQ